MIWTIVRNEDGGIRLVGATDSWVTFGDIRHNLLAAWPIEGATVFRVDQAVEVFRDTTGYSYLVPTKPINGVGNIVAMSNGNGSRRTVALWIWLLVMVALTVMLATWLSGH